VLWTSASNSHYAFEGSRRLLIHSNVNRVADTERWEQSVAYFLDTHPRVRSFVKNARLGFAIPYLLVNPTIMFPTSSCVWRTEATRSSYWTKGYDPLKETKR